MILNSPLSTYILCIVSSEKKNPFIVKYKEKESKNKHIFIEIKLNDVFDIHIFFIYFYIKEII